MCDPKGFAKSVFMWALERRGCGRNGGGTYQSLEKLKSGSFDLATKPWMVFLPVLSVMVAMFFFLDLAPVVSSPNLQHVYTFLFMLRSLTVYLPFIHIKLYFLIKLQAA